MLLCGKMKRELEPVNKYSILEAKYNELVDANQTSVVICRELEREIDNLTIQKEQELEQSKKQLQIQHQNEKNQLRDKINKRLGNSFLFKKSEKGEDLEQVINNLLEKGMKWDEDFNKLQASINQISTELRKEQSRNFGSWERKGKERSD